MTAPVCNSACTWACAMASLLLWVDPGAVRHSTGSSKKMAGKASGLPGGATSTILKQHPSEQTPPITFYGFSLCATTRPSALMNTR